MKDHDAIDLDALKARESVHLDKMVQMHVDPARLTKNLQDIALATAATTVAATTASAGTAKAAGAASAATTASVITSTSGITTALSFAAVGIFGAVAGWQTKATFFPDSPAVVHTVLDKTNYQQPQASPTTQQPVIEHEAQTTIAHPNQVVEKPERRRSVHIAEKNSPRGHPVEATSLAEELTAFDRVLDAIQVKNWHAAERAMRVFDRHYPTPSIPKSDLANVRKKIQKNLVSSNKSLR